MEKVEVILNLFIFLSVVYPVAVRAKCQIYFSRQSNAPLIVQSFGSRRIIVSNPSNLELNDGEKIEAYCSSDLIVDSSCCGTLTKKEPEIHSEVFECISNQLHFDKHEQLRNYNSLILSCSSSSLQLYESNSSLPNCTYMSYGIGMESNEETAKRTGLCYDLDTLSIKYAKYLTYRIDNNVIPTNRPFKEHDVIGLDLELNRFSSLFSLLSEHSFQNRYKEIQNENTLLRDQKFVYKSLLDDSGFFNYNDQSYEDMFQIIWWQNLRNGNWEIFMNALKERSDNVTYMLYTGVSNTLDMPSFENCNKSNEFVIRNNKLTVKAPAFIYAYLQSIQPNVEDDFVVIGYNTPFYTNDKTNEFCIDVCNKIDWLNKSSFIKTHLMPAFGVMTCCRVEDVFDKLENFPYVKENNNISTTQSPI